MGDDHSDAQDIVERMLRYYGLEPKKEFVIGEGKIDNVARRPGEGTPFIGIEIHISGDLDTDIKKLMNYGPLQEKIVLTPDKRLISSMKDNFKEINWFPIPSSEETGFESYLRDITDTNSSKPYLFNFEVQIVNTVTSSGPVANFELLLTENGLNVHTAEDIIYHGSLPGGVGTLALSKYKDTHEYKFLSTTGIIAGIEIFWYDMEWDGKIQTSYEKVTMPNGSSTRKLQGQPLAYDRFKEVIKGMIRNKILRDIEGLKRISAEHPRTFNEIALIGTGGVFSKPTSYPNWPFNPVRLNGVFAKNIPTNEARLEALASNPFLKDGFWEYGKKLLKIGLATEELNDRIYAPYKVLANEIDVRGNISDKEDQVLEYLSWWTLLNSGIGNTGIQEYCEIFDLSFEDVLEKIGETASAGLTSKYIPDSAGIRQMGNFVNSVKGIGNAKEFSIFEKDEFVRFCSEKIKGTLNSILNE